MNTQSSFLLWGTLTLMLSSCCFSLLVPSPPRPEQYEPMDGFQTVFYSDSTLNMSANFDEGILNGEFKSWYPDGQLRFVREYRAGKRVGLETVYYPDGSLFRKGNRDQGDYKLYHSNGQIQLHHDSIASDGTHAYYRWNSAGVLIESVPLVEGKMDGLHQFWSAKGVLRAKGMETVGLRTGLWEYYDEAGGLEVSHDYDDGSTVHHQQIEILKESVPNYRHDGLSYQNDNVMGEEAAVLDGPLINDYFALYLDESMVEPRPLNMGVISKEVGYPMIARDAGVQGNVVVRILVGPDGIPVDNKIITQVSPMLSNQVEFYLMNLRLSPAEIDGEPIYFWVNIPFNFKLLN